jgi:ketosteroid isomerase-like protein
MKSIIVFFVLSCLQLFQVALAEEVDVHAEDRAQLRSILAESERGINFGDISLLTKHIDEDARVTFLNGEVVTGPQGVQAYFQRMVGDDANAVLSQYETKAAVSDLARFYGDVAVANGTMHDVFTPKARGVFEFDSKWSVTFVKKANTWKIVSLHFSTNAFNNALTEELKNKIWQVALMVVLAMMVLMLGVMIWNNRKKGK